MKLPPAFRSLQYPNYRLYFIGQSISLIGTWMQRMAMGWLVYRLTHSGFMLGIVSFAGLIPTFILSPYAGVITDRRDKYKLLLTTQIAAMIQASVLAIAVLSGYYNITLIIILSATLGIINTFDSPSRQSLMVKLVNDKKDIHNAIALNSSMVNMARLAGPVIAGIVLYQFGEGLCFLLNTLSFIAVITCLLLMKLPKHIYTKPTKNMWQEFHEGYVYLRNSPQLLRIIIMLGLLSLLLMPYATLLPIFAKDIFHGNAKTYTLLSACSGLGSLAGAYFLASRKTGHNLNRYILIASFFFGLGLFLFAVSTQLPLALFFIIVAGGGMMTCIAAGNTLVQTEVGDHMRGRVMSFYSMAFFGMQPIGSFFIGLLSDHIGARVTVGLQGCMGLVLAACFLPGLYKAHKQLSKPANAAIHTAQ